MEKLRVVQMGLGPIGVLLARVSALRPGLSLVGAVDPDPALVGRDAGEVMGSDAIGVEVGADANTILEASAADVVLHATGSHMEDVAEQLRVPLRRGVSVVSTCEELLWPFRRHPRLSRELDALARANGAVLLGTGVNPGFVMDKLVVTLLAACRELVSVRVQRVVDAATRRGPLFRKVGAGLSVQEFEERARAGLLGHVGLAESAWMITAALGLSGDAATEETLSPEIATEAIATPHGRVEAGRVAGVAQDVRVTVGGRERVRLELRMYAGAERPRDQISIEGIPPVEMTIEGGMQGEEATVALAVNCAGLVRELAPGLRTMLDVPLRPAGLSAS